MQFYKVKKFYFKCSASEEQETWRRAFRQQNRNETQGNNYPESFSLNSPHPNPTRPYAQFSFSRRQQIP